MSYYEITIHAGAAVSGRRRLIEPRFDEALRHSCYSRLAKDGHRPMAFGAADDHVHFLFGLNPQCIIPDTIEAVKLELERTMVNDLNITTFRFQRTHWAIAVSNSAIHRVVAYVENQRARHGVAEITLDDERARGFR